jgi:DNA-binding NarL/FixJ family response regulator
MRILIVEDIQNELDEIAQRMRKVFPGVQLLLAEDDRKAWQAVRTAVRENRRIDIAVLDIFLDRTSKKPDFTLCKGMREVFPDSLVLHYTVYSDDKDVIDHLNKMKLTYEGYEEIIDKGSAETTNKENGLDTVCRKIKEWWESRLRTLAAAIFPVSPAEPESMGTAESTSRQTSLRHRAASHHGRAFPAPGVRCGTIAANTLLREIADFRKNFSSEGLADMEKRFRFESEGKKWRTLPI